jgi:hypothetical protein
MRQLEREREDVGMEDKIRGGEGGGEANEYRGLLYGVRRTRYGSYAVRKVSRVVTTHKLNEAQTLHKQTKRLPFESSVKILMKS